MRKEKQVECHTAVTPQAAAFAYVEGPFEANVLATIPLGPKRGAIGSKPAPGTVWVGVPEEMQGIEKCLFFPSGLRRTNAACNRLARCRRLTLRLLAAVFLEQRGRVQLDPEGKRVQYVVRTVTVASTQIH